MFEQIFKDLVISFRVFWTLNIILKFIGCLDLFDLEIIIIQAEKILMPIINDHHFYIYYY